jgi:hypothetical protein
MLSAMFTQPARPQATTATCEDLCNVKHLLLLAPPPHAHPCVHITCLQEFLRVNGPELRLPREMTDITTATTIMQLAAPDIQLVLDPLLYLRVQPQPSGIPKLIHMTMKDKHQLAPHQILSMLSWGRFNKGYALLLYDNTDIEQYMQRYYPAFMPSECFVSDMLRNRSSGGVI